MKTERYVALLRQMPVFGGLNNHALELILQHSEFVCKGPQEPFFWEGDAGDSLYVLEDGEVKIEKRWGEQVIELGRLASGDCFGEMSLIDLQHRSATVIAVQECEAIRISRQTLHSLFQMELEQYAIIMMNMGREVSRRLRLADQRLFEMRQQFDSELTADVSFSP